MIKGFKYFCNGKKDYCDIYPADCDDLERFTGHTCEYYNDKGGRGVTFLQFKDSYKVWSPSEMITLISADLPHTPVKYKLLIIEWWIHNVGYWITKPFTFIPAIKRLNLRFKDVDLKV